jgi:general secretion pathway protein K
MLFKGNKGFVLILTLLITALLTAMVTEFTYGVHMDTSALGNWETAQRLSLGARSGLSIGGRLVIESASSLPYTYPGALEIPVDKPDDETEGSILLKVEDENSKFNLNTLVNPNGTLNAYAYESFKRLLKNLSLDENSADIISDWIDPDSEPRLRDSEKDAKNAPLDCTEEIFLITGLKPEVYDKLRPYITAWGNGLININGAAPPVLASLSPSVTDELARRVENYRNIAPFENTTSLTRVAGFETLGIQLLGRITVKASVFKITSDASWQGIRRTIECVLSPSGQILYWKEA